MPYDPTLPANNAPVVSAELRNQFAGLNDLIAARAPRVDSVTPLSLILTDPVDINDLQAIANKLDELIAALQQP